MFSPQCAALMESINRRAFPVGLLRILYCSRVPGHVKPESDRLPGADRPNHTSFTFKYI